MFSSNLLTFSIPDKQQLLALTNFCKHLRKQFNGMNLLCIVKKLLVRLGALHIEMVMLSCIRDWLQDSGWTIALSNSRVTSPIPY